jgi:glycine hydroxymethyltransferase
LQDSFREYAVQVINNAKVFAEVLMNYGFKVISGGTDNHLMLIDLRNKNISGKAAQEVLDLVGITCNKNSVPFDDKSPMITSGIRIGTPAVTTRGMKETEMKVIAELINKIIDNPKDENIKKEVSQNVKELTSRFPLYDFI